MSAHVAPTRWADAWAGKVADAERAVMDKHADGCPRCAKARDRIMRASNSFASIRTQTPPEVAWDSIRARVHWSVSTERRSKARMHGRGFAVLAWGSVAIGGVVLGLASGTLRPHHAEVKSNVAVVPPQVTKPAKLVGVVSRLAGEVMIDGVRRSDAFDRTIGAGTMLATADGHVDIQFGDHSAFALGPRSSLELRQFDAKTIELVIEGTVDVEVAPRAAGQRFLVTAGDQTIEVHGTQFRVTHDGANTKVACHHGLVAVRDARGEIDVPTASKVDVHGDVAGVHVETLSKDELAQLSLATPLALPVWTDTVIDTSSPLEIATVGHRDVRIDGIELGEAPLRVRVMPGRHTVEAVDAAGRYRRAGWIDVTTAHSARLEVRPIEEIPAIAPNHGVALRKKQLAAGINPALLKKCVRGSTKQDLAVDVELEISIDATGAVSYLNLLNSDLSLADQNCVHDALAAVHFPPGPPATWHEKRTL